MPVPTERARSRARCRFSLSAILVCWLLITAPPVSAAKPPGADPRLVPIGVHSMLYLNTPFSAMQAMFKEASAIGASYIRLDLELSGVFPEPNAPPDWSGVDDYMALARQYHLRVLADLTATPWYITDCPPETVGPTYRCPPADAALWGRQAGEIAAHTRGVINDFEIINEPDGRWSFLGTPEQYAAILACAYHAIHAANPSARVLLGGLMDTGAAGFAWMNAVLDTPGADAIDAFDIANIHLRYPDPAGNAAEVRAWRRYYASKGFLGPLWVTETGYPADPAYQTEAGYRDGPRAQARWMTRAIPAMLNAGAAIVFVTERDSLTGTFASEGVLQSTDPLTADPQYTRRPSFVAIRKLVLMGARGLPRGRNRPPPPRPRGTARHRP
jgi:hypothetical protein